MLSVSGQNHTPVYKPWKMGWWGLVRLATQYPIINYLQSPGFNPKFILLVSGLFEFLTEWAGPSSAALGFCGSVEHNKKRINSIYTCICNSISWLHVFYGPWSRTWSILNVQCAHGFGNRGLSQMQTKYGQAYKAWSVLSMHGHCFLRFFSGQHSVAAIDRTSTLCHYCEWPGDDLKLRGTVCRLHANSGPVGITSLNSPRNPPLYLWFIFICAEREKEMIDRW